MSVKLFFECGSFRSSATIKDEALPQLLKIVADHMEKTSEPPFVPDKGAQVPGASQPQAQSNHGAGDRISIVKEWMAKHAASEALSRIQWETYPEKILILAAHFESNGGSEGWRKEDILNKFADAKDSPPANFPRDISVAIKSSFVAPVTPRTYKVARTGWNKLADIVGELA